MTEELEGQSVETGQRAEGGVGVGRARAHGHRKDAAVGLVKDELLSTMKICTGC